MRPRRPFILLALAPLSLLGWAQAAGAKVQPEAPTVPAGGSQVVQFSVDEGCGNAATIRLVFQIPEGLEGVNPYPPAGWQGGVQGKVLIFQGGKLPSKQTGSFGIGFTAPAKVGTVLSFPVVQGCEIGQTPWIDKPSGTYPAPTVKVGAADASATTTTPKVTSTTALRPAKTVIEGSKVPEPRATASTNSAPVIIVGVFMTTILGVAFAVYLRRRQQR